MICSNTNYGFYILIFLQLLVVRNQIGEAQFQFGLISRVENEILQQLYLYI